MCIRDRVKRLHEYKRQLMNILHVMYLYNQLKDNPNLDMVPRTFIFGAKAAAGYKRAKLTIKLINSVADAVSYTHLAGFLARLKLAEPGLVAILAQPCYNCQKKAAGL